MIATQNRCSGILLHITSLPSAFGIGDLGPESYKFVNLLATLKQHYWNILPLNPTNPSAGNSPYKTDSVFAGNPLLISPEQLAEEGLSSKEQMDATRYQATSKVNYEAAQTTKAKLLEKAFHVFLASKRKGLASGPDFETFKSEMVNWLDDYALYKALKKKNDQPWYLWPESVRNREPSAMAKKTESLREIVEKEKFVQYVFFSQWLSLKAYCLKMQVKVFGDLPFYVSLDSADVWSHPELFKLNKRRTPEYKAGVPPDYFSRNGQLWDMPVYDWQELTKTQFEWWINRLKHNLKLCDLLRFDHFRGFVAYWRVPAHAKTAKTGRWIRAPSKSFFEAVKRHVPDLPFVAEDLGVITKPVKTIIQTLGVPGMRVLLFAFDGSQTNPHLPKNYINNCVAYTGTHDTNTVKGWFLNEATQEIKQRVFKYVGHVVSEHEISYEFIKLALTSKSNLCIIPLQDLLSLGPEARMNHPAQKSNNWQWRATTKQLTNEELSRLEEQTIMSDRTRFG